MGGKPIASRIGVPWVPELSSKVLRTETPRKLSGVSISAPRTQALKQQTRRMSALEEPVPRWSAPRDAALRELRPQKRRHGAAIRNAFEWQCDLARVKDGRNHRGRGGLQQIEGN